MRKCNYCDFLSFNAKKEAVGAYFEALKKEIALEASALVADAVVADTNKPDDGRYSVRSIFFGGGTPSFVDAEQICGILEAVRSSFAVAENAEISIEVNPASAIYDKLIAYRKAGFNRISIGAQSLNDEELKVLGRAHTSAMFYETFENARKAGFDNINVDVMSALPGQSLESYCETLRKVVELKPSHISAYSLIIEEGTPFYDMKLDLPDEDTDRAMYHETRRILAGAGYHRYEISNYALEGCECYHNKVYWRRGNYLGLGLGAASMIENVRWSNVRELEEYASLLKGFGDARQVNEHIRHEKGQVIPDRLHVGREALSPSAQMEEFMFLGLRLVEGVDTTEFRRQFGREISDVYGEVIDKYIGLGLLEYAGQALRLTDKGLDVSNTVMAEFLL